MPLADERGLVAALLQELREGLLIAVEDVMVLQEAVEVGVFAGLDDGPAGSAEGVGDEAIVEADALGGYAVEVRSGSDVLEASPVG